LPGFQKCSDVPKGYLSVYVAKNQSKWFVIPLSYLNQPSIKYLLIEVEQEFGFDNKMDATTIPSRDDIFLDASRLKRSLKRRLKCT